MTEGRGRWSAGSPFTLHPSRLLTDNRLPSFHRSPACRIVFNAPGKHLFLQLMISTLRGRNASHEQWTCYR